MTITKINKPFAGLDDLDVLTLDSVIDFVIRRYEFQGRKNMVKILLREIDPDDRHINSNHRLKAIEYFVVHQGIVKVVSIFGEFDTTGVELEVIAVDNLKELQKAVKKKVVLIRKRERIKSTNKNEIHFPYKLPAGTKWGNIIIKFLDQEKVHIEVAGKKHDTDFIGMGFENRKNGKPDGQWIFFMVLAKSAGEITWKNSGAKKENKKRKQLLSDKLQSYFSIDSDPFENYKDKNIEKEKNSYKIKIVLFYSQENLHDSIDDNELDKTDPMLVGIDD